MLRLILSLPLYVAFFLFSTLVTAIGWIVIPPMAALHKHTTKTAISIINGREILVWKYWFMYPWGNDEDGLIGAEEYKDKSIFVRIVYWTAKRNPANNLRFIKYLSVKPVPEKIGFKLFTKIRDFEGNEVALDPQYRVLDEDQYRFTTLTWQGIYSNLRIQFKTRLPEVEFYWVLKYIPIPVKAAFPYKIMRFWIGWKLYPEDQFGLWSYDYRRYGAGFARQLKRIYPR